MAGYVIVDIEVHDWDAYREQSVPQVEPLIKRHGGALTHRIAEFESMEGDWCPRRLLIIEFPDKDAARSFVNDPDYRPVKEIRFGAAHTRLVIGEDTPPSRAPS